MYLYIECETTFNFTGNEEVKALLAQHGAQSGGKNERN